MLAQKGFSLLVIIIIVGIVLSLGGLFFFQKLNSQNANQSTQTISQKRTTSESSESGDQIYFEVSDKKLLLSGGFADPSVIKLADKYIMYVNKFGNGPSVNLAYTSLDGVSWTDTGKKVPGAPTTRAFVGDGMVRLYYTTQVPINPTDPPSQILSALSSDGLTFSNETGIRMLPAAGYTIEGPSLTKLEDGTLRMYFSEFKEESAQERKGARIFGANSKDGLTWIRDQKPSIESDQIIEKAPSDWPQALRPFVLKRPVGGYVMFYNTHSKIYAALSDDGITWEKIGSLGIKGADVDGYYLPDGTIRIYYGDFSEATSGVVYTAVLKEVKGSKPESLDETEPMDNVKPLGSKPPPPPECVGKTASDSNLSQSCQMWFKIR